MTVESNSAVWTHLCRLLYVFLSSEPESLFLFQNIRPRKDSLNQDGDCNLNKVRHVPRFVFLAYVEYLLIVNATGLYLARPANRTAHVDDTVVDYRSRDAWNHKFSWTHS